MKHVLMIFVCRAYLTDIIDLLLDCGTTPTIIPQYDYKRGVNMYLLTCEQYSEFDEIIRDNLDTWRKDTEKTEFRYLID